MPPLEPSNMKVLALWQPWASLLVMSDKDTPPLKTIETRGYAPAARVPFWCAIHAAKRLDMTGFSRDVADTIHQHALFYHPLGVYGLPSGAIVGVVQVYAAERTEELLRRDMVSPTERRFGNYGPKRQGWLCRFPHFFEQPIPHRGQQCLETPTPELAEKILIAMSEAQAKRGVYGWTNALSDEPEVKVA